MGELVMEELREELNRIIEDNNISLCSDQVIRISQELDKHILEFYLKQQRN